LEDFQRGAGPSLSNASRFTRIGSFLYFVAYYGFVRDNEMHWSQEDRRRLVERAAFLHERFDSQFRPAELTPEVKRQAEDRMQRWTKVVANGNDTWFKRRLEWDGLRADSALARLAGVRLKESSPLPVWINSLDEVRQFFPQVAQIPLDDYESSFAYLNPAQPAAFQHLMVPFVEHATMRLRSEHPLGSLQSHALIDLQRYLLIDLAECSMSCLMLEFSAFRALNLQNKGVPAGPANATSPSLVGKTLYNAFISRMWEGRLAEFLFRYPVLARLLSETAETWIAFVGEFLERLQVDMSEIAQFFPGTLLGKVARIATSLSDKHNHGRVVLGIQFDSGASVIYKPKNLASEEAYLRIMDWLDRNGSPLDIPTMSGLYKEGYGWVPAVAPLSCDTREDVQKFYYRTGALLSLFHAIGATDIHAGNLIACREYPLLVDMETILSPKPLHGEAIHTASNLARRDVWDWSVLRTAMLPRWVTAGSRDGDLAAGLLDVEVAPTHMTRVCQSTNTDLMQIVEKQVPGKPLCNMPHLGNRAVPAGEHMAEIVSGFKQMYDFLTTNRDLILAAKGPMDYLSDTSLRFVFRNTYLYTKLITIIRRPEYLRDGAEAGIQADILYKSLLRSQEKPAMWPLVRPEIEALLRGDVPIFKYRSTSDLLEFEDNYPPIKWFAQSPIDAAKARFHRFSPSDRELQVSYIGSVFPRNQNITQEPAWEDAVPDLSINQESSTWTKAALELAVQIRNAARTGRDGTVTWVSRVFDPISQRWRVCPMDARLYDGITGTALFLAALERVTGTTEFHGLLLGAINAVALVLPSTDEQKVSEQFAIGAGIGLGSIIYGLTKIADLLGLAMALDLAQGYARLITPSIIKSDSAFDLMTGAGGCILALLALYRLTKESHLLELAKLCGDHLLQNRSLSESGLRSWKTIQGKMLAGYSHGAAGIAHALIELYRATSLREFRDAANEACGFENSLFSTQMRNWPNLTDLAEDGSMTFWNTWCHGATGIGLGRMACRESLEIKVQNDIDEALNTTLVEQFAALDHPCCGNMGRVELFLFAGAMLGRKMYLDKANQIANGVLRRARLRGHYGLGTNGSFSSPSFHQGVAGIGYQMLRLAAPNTLSSVLLWQ
jgi:type 2 lantibiotic biosynthesis protein LanM